MGLGYLASFMSACADCTIDIINVHHYVDRSDVNVDQAVSAVQSYLSKDVPNFMAKYPQLKNAKICVGEVRELHFLFDLHMRLTIISSSGFGTLRTTRVLST